MANKEIISVALHIDFEDELNALENRIKKVMSNVDSDTSKKLGDGLKDIESEIDSVRKSTEKLNKEQSNSSGFEKIVESLQSQIKALADQLNNLEKTVKDIQTATSQREDLRKLQETVNDLSSSVNTAAESVKNLNKTSEASSSSKLSEELKSTKDEAKETSVALDEVARKAKVYKNQTNSTTSRKGKKVQTLNWTEYTDFFQTVTKNAVVQKDGSLTLTSEKIRTNYEALEKEITKVDKKIIDLLFDMGRQDDAASKSTQNQIDLLREYLQLLTQTRNKQINSPGYLADTGHAQKIDFVRNQVQVGQYSEKLTALSKEIDKIRNKIADINRAGLSKDYIDDLDKADTELVTLSNDLQDLFNKIKSGNFTENDILSFLKNYKDVFSSIDDVLDFRKIDKQLDNVFKKLAKLRIELYSSPEKSSMIRNQIDELEILEKELLKTRAAQATSAGQNVSEFTSKAAINQYTESLKKIQDVLTKTKKKIEDINQEGLSQDYIDDLIKAKSYLDGLDASLDALFSFIKSGSASISDIELFFTSFDTLKSVVDSTINFEKIDKEITKLKNDIIEIDTAIAGAGADTDTEGLIKKRELIQKTIDDLVTERNKELQLSGTAQKAYNNANASIAQYNEEIINTTSSLDKMREKLSSFVADSSRSANFKQTASDLKIAIKNAQDELNSAFLNLKQNPFDPAKLKAYKDAMKGIVTVTEEYNTLIANSTTSSSYEATREDVQKLDNQISAFLDQNTAAANRFKKALLSIQTVLRNTLSSDASMSKFDLSYYTEQVNKIQSEVKSLHQTGNSFFTSLRKQLQSANAQFIGTYFSIQDLIRYGKEIFDTVTEIDSALTELRKVSDATSQRLVQNFENSAKAAKDLGASVSDVINVTADWSRLGYSVDEAEELARVTTLFKNVGDDMDAATASEYMISALQGFQMSADEAERIVDAYNEVANNYAIDTAGIGEALERSAASFNAANTSMEKAIALVTATNEVVQNPEAVGTLWKTMSARIRGASTELAELGEEEDEFTQTTSKLQALVKGLTGFDIMEDEDTFKDIYDIIVGISKEWDNLTDIEQASLGEALAGKRNANALFAVIGNLETLEAAYESASNSAGSAAKEQENYSKSIQYSLDRLAATFEVLSVDLLDSDFAKGLVEFLVTVVELIDELVEHIGVLMPLLTAIGGFSIFKNINNIKGLSDLGKTLVAMGEAEKTVNTLMTAGSTAAKAYAAGVAALTAEQSAELLVNQGLNTALIEQILRKKGLDSVRAKEVVQTAVMNKQLTAQTAGTFSLSAAYKGLASSIGLSTTALTALLGVFVSVAAVAFSAYEVAKAEREIAEAAQEVGQKFSDTKKDIEDYKKEVDELRDVLNNSTDLDELRSAREKLLEIQNQMIDAYGTEAGEVIDLTNTINDQTEAWEKLTEAQWQATKNSFNADKKWNLFDDAARWLNGASDNIDLMLTEIENTAHLIEFAKADKALLESLSQKYDLSYSGNTLIVNGNLYDIQKTVLDIQNTLEKTDGVANSTIESVRNEANEISEIISNYGDLYKQYVYYERILKNDSYKEKFNAVQEAYEDYQEALLNADEQAQEAALKRIVEARESLESEMKSGGLNTEEQSVLNFIDDLVVQVQDKLDSVEFEVKITANTNDLLTHIEEAISEFDNPGSIPDFMLPFGDESYTKEQIEAWRYLRAVAEDYGLTVSELVETLAKLGKIKVDFNYEVPKNLRDEVGRAYGRLQSQMYVGQVEIQEPPISHSDLQDAKEYSETLDDIYKQYNGINNMDRDFIYWDDETLEKYRDFVTEQYGTFEEGAKDLKDTWSTVMGGVEDEGEIKIAFSQLLQTDHGLVPLTEDALWEYIDGIYSKAIDENGVFDVEKFIQLDKEGTQMVINGQVENVANMIAAAEGQYLNGIKLTADDVIAIGTPEDALPEDFGESIFKGFSLHEIQEKTLLGSLNDYLMSLEEETLPTLDELFEELEIDTADEYEAVLAIISGCEDWREAVKRVREAFAEVNDTTEDFNFNSLTDAVNDVNEKLLPQFRELGELYDEVFNGDAGFDLSGIGADDLDGIADAFNNLDAALNINPPTEEVEKFLSVIGNADSTEKQVHDAFDGIATAYFNAAVEAGNFSKENAAILEQMLTEMGIVNASEVVAYYEEVAAAKKLAADNGKNLAEMTALQIEEFAAEVGASDATADALYLLALKQIFLNENWINESDSIQQVLELAKAAGITADALDKLAQIQALQGAIDAEIATGNPNTRNLLDYNTRLEQLQANASEYADAVEQAVQEKLSVDLTFSVPKTSSGGSSASNAGKDAAEEYVKAFEEELKDLERLRDAGVISEKEFLERYKDLIEKYFKDVDGYADEYADRMKDYFDRLTTYYENVFSAISTVLSHRINALQDAKSAAVDAINAEKDAAAESYQTQIDYLDELIDAKEAEIDAIDDEIDRYQDQIDAIDKQIDALEEANQKRQQAINLQKAQYDLERAQQQRTKLIYKGGQLVYENDTSAVRDARENLEDAEFEIQKQKLEDLKKPLQEQIELLEKRKELIQDEIDGYKKQQEALQKALEASNKYYDKMIKDTEKYWDTLIEQLEKTKSKFEEIAELKALSEAYYLIQDYLKGTEYTLEDIFNGTPEMFDKFIEDYKKVLLGANSYNEDFAASLALAEQDIRGSLGNISSSASEIETALGPAVSALVPLGEEATNIEATATALEKVADNSEKVSTNTGTAATNSGELATSLGSVADVAPEVASGVGNSAESIEDEGEAAGIAYANVDKVATANQKLAQSSATIAENIGAAAEALKEEGTNAANAYTSLDSIANLNLATIVTQTNLLADAIGDVAAALGLAEGDPVSVLQTAISNFATISLGDESSGIIGSFNQLKTAVNGVTSAIGGGGGGDSEGGDGTTDKSASMSEGANDSGSGGLISAIGELHGATDTHIGTSAEGGGEEEGGTVISDFNALKEAVMHVAEAVGIPNENGEIAEESLLGVIQTMPEESEEPIHTVEEYFVGLAAAINSCVSAVGDLLDAIGELSGSVGSGGLSLSLSGGGIATGNVHVAEATGNVHAGNAYSSGKLGLKKNETALVGEVGQELVYNPKSGTYRTVGDNGPEITRLQKGDLIFNAEQTKAIVKNGKRDHGRSYADGNAIMPLTSEEMELFKKIGGAVTDIQADVSQMLDPVKAMAQKVTTHNTTNIAPVINITGTSFSVSGVTGEDVTRQISDVFEGMISNAYQRAMKQ